MADLVNHPPHYQGSIECIEAIEAQLTNAEYRGALKANIIKYIWREASKGGVESLMKAKWYLDRLIAFDIAQASIQEPADPDAYMTECKDGFCPMPNVRTGPSESLKELFEPV
jgi:hypothetical protein